MRSGLTKVSLPLISSNLTSLIWASSCSKSARVANGVQEPAREFGNSIGLPPPDGLSRNQLSANAQRHCTGGKEAERGPLVHASRGDHRNVGKHSLKIFDVTVAADVPTRHNFHEIWTQLPRADYAGRG